MVLGEVSWFPVAPRLGWNQISAAIVSNGFHTHHIRSQPGTWSWEMLGKPIGFNPTGSLKKFEEENHRKNLGNDGL